MTAPRAPMPRPDAAALLRVPEDAAPAEVQHAFLRAARRVHPDAMPEADEAERRAAGEAFAALLRARETLLAAAPPESAPFLPRGDAEGPRYRRVEGRGLGGSLVVLALLAFLLVALVTAQQAMRGDPFVGLPDSSTSAP